MPQSNRSRTHQQSKLIAFSGLMTALSVVVMLTGGLIPIMTYVSPLLAGLLLLPIMLEFNASTAWTAWGATALIVLLLGVDREAAAFYLFIGYYPLLKWKLDRIHAKPIRILSKLAVFTISFGTMYSLLAFVFRMDALLQEFGEMGLWMTIIFFIMLIVCMFLYDRMLMPVLLLYEAKVRPRLHLSNR